MKMIPFFILFLLLSCKHHPVPRLDWKMELVENEMTTFSYHIQEDNLSLGIPYTNIEMSFSFPEMIDKDGGLFLSRNITIREGDKAKQIIMSCLPHKLSQGCKMSVDLDSGKKIIIHALEKTSEGVVTH
jgi:hypothetical protein